jgi:gamma-glutamyltranspeptidase/glutathione hydrolase
MKVDRSRGVRHARAPQRLLLVWLSCVGVLGAGPSALAQVAAIATPDEPSAAVAAEIFARGGNAVDVAVAVAFTLAVTYPEAGNLGGGGFATLWMDGQPHFLDFREVAPRAATRDMYLDENGEVITGASLVGHRAAGVPGTVAGLWALHQKFGSLSWPSLLAPAIRLAREGFVPHPQLIARLQEGMEDFAGKTNFAQYFSHARTGEVWQQRSLSTTLALIASYGTADFYRGAIASLIVSEMQDHGGLIDEEDLRAYTPKWREPLLIEWRGHTLITAPPPSSGGIALAQFLRMKETLAPQFQNLAHNSPGYVHLIAEIAKRVFADRAEFLGDPDFTEVPQAALIADDYLRTRARSIRPEAISDPASITAGPLQPSPVHRDSGRNRSDEPLETTHFSVLDAQGNAVSLTYTLNGSFGNGVVVSAGGFLLNNEMDDFSIKPGVPNLYGVVGGRANEIVPGKRMLSSMAPTIVVRDGQARVVLGTPGGSTIFPAVFQTLLNLFDFGMSAQEAVDAARFHHQLLPANLIVHSRCCTLGSDTTDSLRKMGYRVEMSPWEFGDMQLIVVDDAGSVSAAADVRGRGQARIFPPPAP